MKYFARFSLKKKLKLSKNKKIQSILLKLAKIILKPCRASFYFEIYILLFEFDVFALR